MVWILVTHVWERQWELSEGGSKNSLASCVLNISGTSAVKQVFLDSPLDFVLY